MNQIQKFYNDHSTHVKIALGIAGAAAIYGIAVIKTANGYKWKSTSSKIWSENHPDVANVAIEFHNGKIMNIPASLP